MSEEDEIRGKANGQDKAQLVMSFKWVPIDFIVPPASTS